MPLPAQHERLIQIDVKMVLAPELSLRGGRRPTWHLAQAAAAYVGPRRKQRFQISTPREKWKNFSEKYFEILLLCAILHLQVLHGVQFLFIRSNGEVMT